MALQGKNRGVLAFSIAGLEQAIEELNQVCRVPKEIQRLVSTTNRIKAVLKDAEKKQTSSEAVRVWLWKLRQVAFDAEDLIDEFATDAAVHSMGSHTHNIPTMTPDMMGQIREMNDRLDHLELQISMLGLQLSTVEDSRLELSEGRQTGFLPPDATSVIGRDREKEQIIEILTQFDESSSNNKGFSIVPIVGLGGMGKTTLAQLVFNDEKVKTHFELMMWVCVSNDFDCERLAKGIIEAALAYRGKNEQCQINNWDLLQRRLLEEVEGKTFLLVLDDVWGAERAVWEQLFKPLHSGKKGSKVLVTARNRVFVDKLEGRMESPIPLGGLSDDDIWVVFKRCAFKGNIKADGTTSAECSHLEDLGRCIVEKLKGSPLAARTTGSLLNRELSVQHWKTVLESEFWTLEQGEGDSLPSLQQSYEYLSANLKQCFAYCSLFPKDHAFLREQAVQLWEAQSFIKKDRGTRMEAVGSKYFDELLHMSFLELRVDNNYVMHDLIHDLAEHVSRGDCFRLEDQKLVEVLDTVRPVSVCVTEMDQIDMINKLCLYEKLRTLLFFPRYLLGLGVHLNTNDLDQLFLKLKMLRVLGLSYCQIRELPGSIGDLKHLRYIDLQGNYDLENLPESLGNLYNLQVLNLYYCRALRVLPSTMSQLVNLRHLRTDDYELVSSIDGLGKLTGLQELQVRGREVRELGGMCMLRELTVHNLEEMGSEEEAIQARLHTMEHLQVLKLLWSRKTGINIFEWEAEKRSLSMNQDSRKLELQEEVLQALRPNKGIRELHIQGYGGIKSPDWMEVSTLTSFSSLRRVSLLDGPNWQVPPCSFLGQLRHLEYLEISWMPEWEEWSCPVSWDCLYQLTIRDCPRLKRLPLLPRTLKSILLNGVGISFVEGGIKTTSSPDSPPTSASCDNLTSISLLLQQQLPDLEEIDISDCKNLVSLTEKGFGHLVSLKRLRITNCPKLTCLLPMQEEEDAQSQHLPCSLEALGIEECDDAMGGYWWASLQRHTSGSKLYFCGCSTTVMLVFLRLARHHHHYLPATLRELLIGGYNRFDYEQQSAKALRAFTSLKELTILRSPNFLQEWGACSLPSSLELLSIVGDDNLDHKCLSACLHDLISLKELTLGELENLLLLPNLSALTSLETLDIERCHSIETVEVMSLPTSLKKLTLSDCDNLRSLPNMSSLASLDTLYVSHCPSIETWEVMSLVHTSLKSLTLEFLDKLCILPNLSGLSSLETLYISHCPSIETLEVMSLPCSLKQLTLAECEALRSLPNLSDLASLETLDISECPSIQSWPTNSLPSSLQTLEVWECPALTERHKDKPKSMWPEVAHIPKVIIAGRRLE